MPANAVLDRPMTVAGFLDWEPGDGRRYQLIDGRPVAMAPGSRGHGMLVSAASREIGNHLKAGQGCTVATEAGIVPLNPDRSYFVADIAVSCVPHRQSQAATPEPILIVEVLSPGTETEDRGVKVPAYQTIPSVREVALIAQDRAAVTVFRRTATDIWTVDAAAGLDGVLRLDSIDFALPLAELYRGLDIGGD
ncbi:MAG: Uma2 family endonuclease [Alphaproteobacteria bacterium]|jgi:Uma2 family endonuclease|nr:Uma2 family endonuclease [Alphaproteobacteria bacterium]